ncbi:MAG: RluA family pseudouridine synthase [Treponema sp.]|nr:RluA family pseudouridine synthase [Treponema sp.]
MHYFSVKVPEDYTETQRLDSYIATLPNGMNRSKLKSGATEILVNGKSRKLSFKVKAGDQIDIRWEDNVPDDIEPEDIPLDIIYEGENVCVVNKKQGMVTHPACGNWTGTLVNALLYHWGRENIPQLKEGNESEILLRRRPGIVHRLDKETSGVIITAKNRDAEEYLQEQFRHRRKMTKEYIAICCGRPPSRSGVIKTNIIRDPKHRRRFRAVLDETQGKYAETAYTCIACYGQYSLMVLHLHTGRTHQIRVHMKHLNCPILGDDIYYKKDSTFPNATLMLHARKLRIVLPEQSEPSVFIARTPERFIQVEKRLKHMFKKTIMDKKDS